MTPVAVSVARGNTAPAAVPATTTARRSPSTTSRAGVVVVDDVDRWAVEDLGRARQILWRHEQSDAAEPEGGTHAAAIIPANYGAISAASRDRMRNLGFDAIQERPNDDEAIERRRRAGSKHRVSWQWAHCNCQTAIVVGLIPGSRHHGTDPIRVVMDPMDRMDRMDLMDLIISSRSASPAAALRVSSAPAASTSPPFRAACDRRGP